MKIAISELTKEQLNEWAARARGYFLVNDHEVNGQFWAHEKLSAIGVSHYTPTTNPAQWAELLDKFITCLYIYHTSEEQVWAAEYGNGEQWCEGPTPAIAICRAVVASVYGDTVEVNNG